jgi:hypothetical protein
LITKPNGEVFLNELRRYVKGCIVAPDASVYPVATPAKVGSNPGQSPQIFFQGSQDSFQELYALMGRHGASDDADVTRRLTVKLFSNTFNRFYMNRDILVDHVFGTGQKPFNLIESIFHDNMQTTQLQFFNNSTAGTSAFYPNADAGKMQSVALSYQQADKMINSLRRRKAYLYPYWLSPTEAISVAASGTYTALIQIPETLRFTAFAIMARAITTGVAGDTNQVATYQLFDPTTQRPLQNSPVSFGCGTGDAQLPFMLPCGWLMHPRTTLQIVFNNLITDQATEIFFTIFGVAQSTSPATFARDNPVNQVGRGAVMEYNTGMLLNGKSPVMEAM